MQLGLGLAGIQPILVGLHPSNAGTQWDWELGCKVMGVPHVWDRLHAGTQGS